MASPSGLFFALLDLVLPIFAIIWDLFLATCNFILPLCPSGSLVAEEYNGQWPRYVPPGPSDSRCSCPGLNAMANHGIISRDGRDISFRELGQKMRSTYNVSPSFSFFVPHHAAKMLNKNYFFDKFDLSDLDLRSDKGIEHDASLLRQDPFFQPDQGKVDRPLAERLLASASGKDDKNNTMLTIQDMADNLAKRRIESKATNSQYSLRLSHRVFGYSNAATLLRIFGGRVQELRSFVVQERIPQGWESNERARFGLTITSFNVTVFKIGQQLDENRVAGQMAKCE